ncbi:MAG: hypothetical protein ABIH49_00445 [archaeon]
MTEYVLTGIHRDGIEWMIARGSLKDVRTAREIRLEEQENVSGKFQANYKIMPLNKFKTLNQYQNQN